MNKINEQIYTAARFLIDHAKRTKDVGGSEALSMWDKYRPDHNPSSPEKVIVWSEIKGYMWAELENGLIYDELGRREDLETRQNTSLIQMQLENENG